MVKFSRGMLLNVVTVAEIVFVIVKCDVTSLLSLFIQTQLFAKFDIINITWHKGTVYTQLGVAPECELVSMMSHKLYL